MDWDQYVAEMAHRLVKDMSLEQLIDYAEDAIIDSWSDRALPRSDVINGMNDVPRKCMTAEAWREGDLIRVWKEGLLNEPLV